MKRTNIAWSTAVLVAAGLMMVPSAKASFTFTLGTGNSAISGYSGPYAQVDVNLTDSTHATITFTSLTAGGNTYLMGDGGTVGVNVNGTYTLGAVSESNAGTGFTPTYKNNTPGTEDGFGSFNLSLNNKDGFGDAADTITFTITDTSGTWASDSDVLTANAGGSLAAAHIFVTSSPASSGSNGGSALVTGYAADGAAVVPETGTVLAGALLLLPLGASTLRILRRNRIG